MIKEVITPGEHEATMYHDHQRACQLARELRAYIRKICQQKAVFKQKENKDLPACQRAEGIYTKALYLVYVKKMVQS